MLARNEGGETQPGKARLRELDLAHHLPAQQNYRLMQTLGGSRIITRAEGCYIYDADGAALLDGMAGPWGVKVGYGPAELPGVPPAHALALRFHHTLFLPSRAPPV